MQIDKIYQILKKQVASYNVPVVDLIQVQTESPFRVLVGALLSARTNDRTTSAVCTKLFRKVKKISDFDKLSIKQIEKLIYPVGFYKNKAKYIKKLSKVLREDFNNQIPNTIEELVELPGVGRKTANLVVAVAFKKPAICVDVHVHRIMNRLGYLKTKNPLQTEMALREKLPKKYWRITNKIFVAFGQNLCRPVSPFCSKCPISAYCNRTGVKVSR